MRNIKYDCIIRSGVIASSILWSSPISASAPRWNAVFDSDIDVRTKEFVTKLLADLGEKNPSNIAISVRGLRWAISEPQDAQQFLIRVDDPANCRDRKCLTIAGSKAPNETLKIDAMFYAGKYLNVFDHVEHRFDEGSIYFCTTDKVGCDDAVMASATARGWIIR